MHVLKAKRRRHLTEMILQRAKMIRHLTERQQQCFPGRIIWLAMPLHQQNITPACNPAGANQ
jgi:hypothetical protein